MKPSTGQVEISVGSEDGMVRGHALEVRRGFKVLGQITITDIETDRSVASFNSKLQQVAFREGDEVITH